MPRGASGRAPDFPGCRVLPGCTPDGPRWAQQSDFSANNKQSKLVDGAGTRRGAFTPEEKYFQHRLYSINRKVSGHIKPVTLDP